MNIKAEQPGLDEWEKNGTNWVSREKKGRSEKKWRCKLNAVKLIVGYSSKNILYRFQLNLVRIAKKSNTINTTKDGVENNTVAW